MNSARSRFWIYPQPARLHSFEMAPQSIFYSSKMQQTTSIFKLKMVIEATVNISARNVFSTCATRNKPTVGQTPGSKTTSFGHAASCDVHYTYCLKLWGFFCTFPTSTTNQILQPRVKTRVRHVFHSGGQRKLQRAG